MLARLVRPPTRSRPALVSSFAGRGFVAYLLHNSGYEIVFADVKAPLVDKLNEQPSYKVIEVGTDGVTRSTITKYRAIHSETHVANVVQEVATASVVARSAPTISSSSRPLLPEVLIFDPTMPAQSLQLHARTQSPPLVSWLSM